MSGCSAAARAGQRERAERPSLLEVFRAHGPAYAAGKALPREQWRFLRDVQRCRTAALGGHLYVCDHCGYERPVYNSCRNRHCPECQALDQARWIEQRSKRILPVGHHHVVFTVPSQLRPLARAYPASVYGALCRAASRTLTELADRRWHARIGVTIVLHTWTRELQLHPHVHCLVTAGGLSLDDAEWIDQSHFLYPVRQLKRAFATRMLAELESLREQDLLRLPEERAGPEPRAWKAFVETLPGWRRWTLHVQRPFGRSTHVLKYLGRYTHRVALSDARVVAIAEGAITFRTRGDDQLTLEAGAFIHRFLQHILPRGFHKIRHYGLYAAGAHRRLKRAREILGGDRDGDDVEDADGWAAELEQLTGSDPLRCPQCELGSLVRRGLLQPEPRPPP